MAMDEETLASMTLTFCIDGAESLMHALVRGAGGAAGALRLLDGATRRDRDLDAALLKGLARWGRRPSARGMAAFHTSVERWRARLGELPSRDPASLEAWFTGDGTMWVLAPHHPAWPRRLDDLELRTDWAPPLCLWGLGDPWALSSCDEPVAVVGSRAVTDTGRYVARSVAQRAAVAGHLVVSGGALGVDAAAHWGALAARDESGGDAGRTAAVFAGGLDHAGPARNRELFDRIQYGGGALVSELCPGTIPEARRFLLRNRLIAALTSLVVVAQARLRSGALNTAGWACELGRTVVAAPGEITSPAYAGCNRLIAGQKAALLMAVTDIDSFCHRPHAPRAGGETGEPDVRPQDAPMAVPSSDPSRPTLFQAQREPAGDGSDCAHEPAEGASDGRERALLRAVDACARRHAKATVDGLLAVLNAGDGAALSPRPGKDADDEACSAPFSVAEVNRLVGHLEMRGLLAVEGGVIRPRRP